jgi:hypothetical protein
MQGEKTIDSKYKTTIKTIPAPFRNDILQAYFITYLYDIIQAQLVYVSGETTFPYK